MRSRSALVTRLACANSVRGRASPAAAVAALAARKVRREQIMKRSPSIRTDGALIRRGRPDCQLAPGELEVTNRDLQSGSENANGLADGPAELVTNYDRSPTTFGPFSPSSPSSRPPPRRHGPRLAWGRWFWASIWPGLASQVNTWDRRRGFSIP